MKIGIFTECYKPVMNGVVVSVETFKKALEEKGHEVFVFAPEHKDAVAEHGVYRFPSIEDKKGRLYPVMIPSVALECSYLPEEVIKDLDIIHAQHMFTAGRLARCVARKYNKPLVYTYHTLIALYTHYAGLFSPLVAWYLKGMSRRFCNTCDKVITPSESMKKILLSYGITTPIEVVMTGIEPKLYKRITEAEARELKIKYKIPEGKKILLYLSRVAKEKNLGLLLKAHVKIKEAYPDCHLVIAGGGPEEQWCRDKISELKLEDRVTMTGMLPREETYKMFGMADIFTFPSYSETQGIVVAEAMAAGTPPVAVNKMGPTDLVHNGSDGFLTRLTVSDFAEHVLKLLKDEKLHDKFATEGLRRVDEFSNETSVKLLISLYEKAIDEKRSEIQGTQEVAESAR